MSIEPAGSKTLNAATDTESTSFDPNTIEQIGNDAVKRYHTYQSDISDTNSIILTKYNLENRTDLVAQWKKDPNKVFEKIQWYQPYNNPDGELDYRDANDLAIEAFSQSCNFFIAQNTILTNTLGFEEIAKNFKQEMVTIKTLTNSLSKNKSIEDTKASINEIDISLNKIIDILSAYISKKMTLQDSYNSTQLLEDKKTIASTRIELDKLYRDNPGARKVNSLVFQYREKDKIFGIKKGILLYTTLLGENLGVMSMYTINDAYLFDKKLNRVSKNDFLTEELKNYSGFYDTYPKIFAHIEEQRLIMINEITKKHQKKHPIKTEDSEKILQSSIIEGHNEFKKTLASKLPGLDKKNEAKLIGYCCKAGLLYTLLEGKKIHFVLDGIDMNPIVNKVRKIPTFGIPPIITNQEMRFARRIFKRDEEKGSHLSDNIVFWEDNKIVEAPWKSHPEVWQAYQPKMKGMEILESIIERAEKSQETLFSLKGK